jgi:hypothetical protein
MYAEAGTFSVSTYFVVRKSENLISSNMQLSSFLRDLHTIVVRTFFEAGSSLHLRAITFSCGIVSSVCILYYVSYFISYPYKPFRSSCFVYQIPIRHNMIPFDAHNFESLASVKGLFQAVEWACRLVGCLWLYSY